MDPNSVAPVRAWACALRALHSHCKCLSLGAPSEAPKQHSFVAHASCRPWIFANMNQPGPLRADCTLTVHMALNLSSCMSPRLSRVPISFQGCAKAELAENKRRKRCANRPRLVLDYLQIFVDVALQKRPLPEQAQRVRASSRQ